MSDFEQFPRRAGRPDRKQRIRREILDAAGLLFDEEGYAHVTVRRIAERIGYSQGVVFYYFKDKADILASLCRETFEGLSERFEEIDAGEQDCVRKLLESSRAYIVFGRSHPHHYRITFAPPTEYEGISTVRFIGEIGQRAFQQLNGLMQRCILEGYFRPVDLNAASYAWWSAVHGLTMFLISQADSPFVHAEGTTDLMLDILQRGLAVGGSATTGERSA